MTEIERGNQSMMRLHICLSCGYREHIGGKFRPGTMHTCPACGGMSDFGAAMCRFAWQRADGTEWSPTFKPGMVLEEQWIAAQAEKVRNAGAYQA